MGQNYKDTLRAYVLKMSRVYSLLTLPNQNDFSNELG